MRRHLSALGFEGYGVALALVGNQTSQTLNARYRNTDAATNVLSFGYGLEDRNMGDVVLNGEWALRRAKEKNLPYESVVLRLWVHGLLHLAGYDHSRGASAEMTMRTLERLLLATTHPHLNWELLEGIFDPCVS